MMSTNSDRISTEVRFGLDDLPKFSVGSFRDISREERMDRIVASISKTFSQDLSEIIKESKPSTKTKKTATRRANPKSKKTA